MGKPTFDSGILRLSIRKDRGLWISAITRRDETPEYIGGFKQTRGTETSQYPEERTSTETPLVVASERGLGQCFGEDNWNHQESWASEGDSPVQVMLSQSHE